MNDQKIVCLYKKALVIDDSQIDRYIADTMLRSYNFASEIILKESARAGLDFLNASANNSEDLPEVIFLDINMPEIDGFGFLHKFKDLPDIVKQQCVIWMLTSSENKGDYERAMGIPYVKKFLNKPLSKQKIDEWRKEGGL